MIKKAIIILILLLLVGISGCTIKQNANETFGEKTPVGVNSLFIINSTGENYDYNGTTYYYVWGYIGNKAGEEARNVNITASVFDKNGKLIATNSTTNLRPKNIPPQGNSQFSIRFNNYKNNINSFKLNITQY